MAATRSTSSKSVRASSIGQRCSNSARCRPTCPTRYRRRSTMMGTSSSMSEVFGKRSGRPRKQPDQLLASRSYAVSAQTHARLQAAACKNNRSVSREVEAHLIRGLDYDDAMGPVPVDREIDHTEMSIRAALCWLNARADQFGEQLIELGIDYGAWPERRAAVVIAAVGLHQALGALRIAAAGLQTLVGESLNEEEETDRPGEAGVDGAQRAPDR